MHQAPEEPAVDPESDADTVPDLPYQLDFVEDDLRPHPLTPAPTGRGLSVRGLAGGFATGRAPQLSEPATTTPLAIGESEGAVPAGPLWAMKYLRHGQHGLVTGRDADDELRLVVGDGDDAIYLIDDGPAHAMVARPLGAAPDGCLYCLVARVQIEDVEQLRQGWIPASDLFVLGAELTLCAVADGPVSNVIRVRGYRKYRDVPVEFLPPEPFIDFPDLL
jgi:hypothetical protein